MPGLLARWQQLIAGASKGAQRKLTKLMVQALGRADRPVATLLLRELWQVEAPERALRLRVLSRIAARTDVPDLAQALGRGLQDADARVVREAVRAVGKLDEGGGDRFESALIGHLQDAALPEQRAAAEALGKVGGGAGLAALRGMTTDDPELGRRCAQAVALIERRRLRHEATHILSGTGLPKPASVLLRCRRGTARFAREQACRLLGLDEGDIAIDPLGITLSWTGTLEQLHRVRISVDAALVFDLVPGDELGQRIAETLSRPTLVASLGAWSDGPLRFRLSFVDGSARRATVRAVASSLDEWGVPLHNDSRGAPWHVQVDTERARLLCVPRDPGVRFAYRRVDIPAASHPTLAALMAWVAQPRPGEVVWDAFCGSGSELIECARLQPGVELYGTDQSADALAAAAQNLKAAGVDVAPGHLVRADALQSTPGADATIAPSLIITNPPMGRRTSSGYGVHELLQRFVAYAATLLPAGGRLVWVSPAAKVSAAAGRNAGLQVVDHGPVDLAGLRVHLQVMTR